MVHSISPEQNDKTTLSVAPILDPDAPTLTGMNRYKLPVSATCQSQLNEEMNTEYPVELYDTYLFGSPMPLTNSYKAPAKKVFVVTAVPLRALTN
jgi:hypothetical protein